jgi:GT2 family glycosyltransferase
VSSSDDDSSVTAVVVGYNHAHCLGRCFDSLMGQRELSWMEVLYVDNASSDSSAAMSSWHPEIQVLRNSENLGFARAVNQGLARARGRYVALVNPDTALDPLTFRHLIDALRARPGVALAAPRLLGEDGREQRSLSHYPTLSGQLRRLLRRPADGATGWLVGAMVLAEADLLRRLGGLDASYFVYGEDMDLSHRIQRLGLALHVARDHHITHTGNPRWTLDRHARVYGAYLRFLERHFPRQRWAMGLPVSALWILRGLGAGADLAGLYRGLLRIWSSEPDQPPEGRP